MWYLKVRLPFASERKPVKTPLLCVIRFARGGTG